MTKKLAHILASRHFLCEELPQNWDELSENDFNEFVGGHRADFLEYRDVQDVWEQIEMLAEDFLRVANGEFED